MKKNLTTIILAVVTLYGYGQNLAGTFLPRANDEICITGGQIPHVTWSFVKIENRLSKTATII